MLPNGRVSAWGASAETRRLNLWLRRVEEDGETRQEARDAGRESAERDKYLHPVAAARGVRGGDKQEAPRFENKKDIDGWCQSEALNGRRR